MSRQEFAITTCRVSSVEQLQSNSLNRQQRAVVTAASELGVVIPDDGQWSGSVSSKAGTNIHRKDLHEMLEYCRKNKAVKYLIVDEVDRFMRSVKELFYYEVEFEKLGVKVWYATQPDLNSDDHTAKLLKAIEVFKAEGTNVERQNKSIKGQTDALKEGRYPFAPKPGYRRGYETAVQEIDSARGPILRKILEKIAVHLVTPSQGLVELNNSEFVTGRSPYKMDKFRQIITDPFYAGILEIDKQVKVRNENGLHVPLITKEQHYELVKIMSGKPKNQSGPRKNGNPKYPLSNLVTCKNCLDSGNGRFVGLDLHNGKNRAKIYEKYRCRACKRYLTKQDVHSQVERQFEKNPLTKEGMEVFIKSLCIVWKENEGQAVQETVRIQHQIKSLERSVEQKVEAVTDPSNASIKDDILASIEKKKSDITKLEKRLEELKSDAEEDWEEFLRYAYGFVDNMGRKFLETSKENRLRCKQIVFPAGFYVDANKKVYTPEISPLITLAAKKKSTEVLKNSQMVRVRGL